MTLAHSSIFWKVLASLEICDRSNGMQRLHIFPRVGAVYDWAKGQSTNQSVSKLKFALRRLAPSKQLTFQGMLKNRYAWG